MRSKGVLVVFSSTQHSSTNSRLRCRLLSPSVACYHGEFRTPKKQSMVVDLLAAVRRPLQRLLHDCCFSEWENIALFLDGGATEAVRWAGGLGFVLEELGISLVVDLQVCFSVCARI